MFNLCCQIVFKICSLFNFISSLSYGYQGDGVISNDPDIRLHGVSHILCGVSKVKDARDGDCSYDDVVYRRWVVEGGNYRQLNKRITATPKRVFKISIPNIKII